MDGRRTGNCSGVPRQSPSRARRGVRGADTRVQTCGGLTGVRAKAALGGDHGSVSLEGFRSEENTSELQSLMRISYAVFCLKKKKITCRIYDIIYIQYATD